ncbi:hypothetical protein UlMin_025556 [Ulmus minor]
MALSWPFLLTLVSIMLTLSAAEDDRKAYIVYMGDTPKSEVSTLPLHMHMVQQVVGSEFAPGSLLHSYNKSFNGFAARLTEKEAQQMSGKEGVVSVFPCQKQELHTTKSWDFIGFPQQVKRSTVESDIIIGVFDTGIWPESESFNDKGFGPPPAKWKGECQVSSNFTCNNKLIGGKYYKSDGEFFEGDIKSPRDGDGHGTHTASTAAGGLVSQVSMLGFGAGTARGGVPSARIAAYKVCWLDGCSDADILAAFDDAIADGVDIISISISSSQSDYFKNAIAIGTFHAVRKGILTSTSAGNTGPRLATVRNYAPWSLSVAATTIDRDFSTKVELGNNKICEGNSINAFDLKNKMFPIIRGGDATNTTSDNGSFSRYCDEGSLDKNLVKGKIVVCDGYGNGPLLAGAVGVVISGKAAGATASVFPLPASYLSLEEASKIGHYINLTRNATASILRSDEGSNKLAPYIASFSSRGPNPVTPNILKPDLAAPGVHILAAWPSNIPISGYEEDKRLVSYNIISGTSMACPHASAAAAYVKSFHPTWSPAAIKSSLITTATPISPDLNPEAEFAYGAGQINPLKAAYPGLVYDADEHDYIEFLCGQGYTTKLLRIITGDNSSCPSNGTDTDLNYPAFVLSTKPSESINHVFHRTVTNVGSPTSTYKSNLVAPQGLNIKVNPSVLTFTSLGQKLSYAVTVEGKIDHKIMVSTSLVWDDCTFQVRSPIVVYVPS